MYTSPSGSDDDMCGIWPVLALVTVTQGGEIEGFTKCWAFFIYIYCNPTLLILSWFSALAPEESLGPLPILFSLVY